MPKARIVAELLVVISLALGIWLVLRPKNDAPKQGPNPEQIDTVDSPKLLRGASVKTPKPETQGSPSNGLATTNPVATAPGPAESELGKLAVRIVDENDQPVSGEGWLISEDCNWKVAIKGDATISIEPLECGMGAVLDIGGQPRITEVIPVVVRAGETTPITLKLLPPEVPTEESNPDEVFAHPGLGLLKQENYAEIVQIVPGSSAAENQLQIGDLVLSIGGVAVAELTQEEILTRLQGAPDSVLGLMVAIEQNGELVDGDVELRRNILIE